MLAGWGPKGRAWMENGMVTLDRRGQIALAAGNNDNLANAKLICYNLITSKTKQSGTVGNLNLPLD
jgi:hypothetical protein